MVFKTSWYLANDFVRSSGLKRDVCSLEDEDSRGSLRSCRGLLCCY
jgi:hypothetical protein